MKAIIFTEITNHNPYQKFQTFHMQRIPAPASHKTWCDINELNQMPHVLKVVNGRGVRYKIS